MAATIEKQLFFLKASVAVLGVLVVGLAAGIGRQPERQHFAHISVERIDVLEPDGRLAMVVSNQAQQPDPVVAGQSLNRDERSPGIIFYNELGDEMGGLIWSARSVDGEPQGSAQLSFDQFQQDQTLALLYSESGGDRLVGMRIWDRPEIPSPEHATRLAAVLAMPDGPEREAALAPLRAPTRVFVGKSGENAALWLLDPEGRPRIKLAVGADGEPRLELLDAAGKVTDRLGQPPASS